MKNETIETLATIAIGSCVVAIVADVALSGVEHIASARLMGSQKRAVDASLDVNTSTGATYGM